MTDVNATPSMLSTKDNPFDPFTQFDEWNAYDLAHGYGTCAYLARITKTSDDLSEANQTFAIAEAIDEIVELNILGLYIKVTEESFKVKATA